MPTVVNVFYSVQVLAWDIESDTVFQAADFWMCDS